MLIRRLNPAHTVDYRAIMLQAYGEEPHSFTSTVAEREPLPLDWWQTRLSDDPSSTGLAFGAFVGFVRYGTEPYAVRYGERFISLVHMSLTVLQDES